MKPTLYQAQPIADPEADAAMKELKRAGFEMKKLSVIGKDHHTDEQVLGCYNAGARNRHAGFFGLGRGCFDF